jgi:hypothetical protein
MALSQVQIIRSLGEALTWFEKELGWEVKPAELNHLTGRIGELYAAMITRGQMALATNQHGYDVVGADGERISVKTVTTATHVSFRKSTFHHVDRVMVLRINVDEGEASIEELLDCCAARIGEFAAETESEHVFRIRAKQIETRPIDDLAVVAEANFGTHTIRQLENGSIMVTTGGGLHAVSKPALKEIAAQLGVSLLNGSGNSRNTRQLGAEILAVLKERAVG